MTPNRTSFLRVWPPPARKFEPPGRSERLRQGFYQSPPTQHRRAGAEVVENAGGAVGLAGVADPAPVHDQAQPEVGPLLRRQHLADLGLDLDRVLLRVRPSLALRRVTWVSTASPGKPKATPRTTLAVLRPTPGSVTRSSIRGGTWPSKRSTSALAQPMLDRVLALKKPVGWIIASSSAGSASAKARASG